MKLHDRPIRVDCYAGSQGEEAPRRLWGSDGWEELTVVDRWVSEAPGRGNRSRWFRVRLAGGVHGLIYHDENLDLWFWRALDPGS